MPDLNPLPSLDELVADPSRVVELQGDERRRYVSQLAGLIVLLESSAVPNATARAAPTPEPSAERLVTVPVAAERMGFAKSYVYELIRRGELRAVKRGKYVRLRQSAIEEWTRAHENG